MVRHFNDYMNDFSSYGNEYFKRPSTPASGGANQDSLDKLAEWQQKKAPHIEPDRSWLDRALSPLMAVNYVSAGIADSFVNEDRTFMEGITGGIKAGNPFGKGYSKGQVTYSDVFESAGWEPEGLVGKFAKGTAGFIADVALDPTTYLTGGLSAVVKGTGRTGSVMSKAEKALGKYASDTESVIRQSVEKKYAKNTDINPDLIKRFADEKVDEALGAFKSGVETFNKTKEMTPDLAGALITNSNKARNVTRTSTEFAQDVEKYTDKFNSLTGVRDVGGKGQGVTFGLGNLPFGEKIFGKTLGKTAKISDGNMLRKIGDKSGMGRSYSKLRDTIYGTKIGRMFSTNSGAYQLAKTDPESLYHTLRYGEITSGLSMDKLAKEKSIHNFAHDIKGFTPDQSRDVIKALEDKRVISKVRDAIKVTDTNEAKKHKDALSRRQSETYDQIVDFEKAKHEYGMTKKANDDGVIDAGNALEAMREDYMAKLYDIDLRDVKSNADVKKIIHEKELHIEELNKIIEAEDAKDVFQKNLESEASQKVIASHGEYKVESSRTGKYHKLREDLMEKQKLKGNPDDLTNMSQKQVVKALRETYGEELTKAQIELAESAPSTAGKKLDTINNLSEFVYGKRGKIAVNVYDADIDEAVRLIKQGADKESILMKMSENPRFLSGHARDVDQTVAQQIGYGAGTEFKNWDEFFQKRYEPLSKKLRSEAETGYFGGEKGKGLNQYEKKLHDKLSKALELRTKLRHDYSKMTPDELRRVKQDQLQEQLLKDVDSFEHMWDSSGRNAYSAMDQDVYANNRRSRFTNEDRARDDASGSRKTNEFDDDKWINTSADNAQITPGVREGILDDIYKEVTRDGRIDQPGIHRWVEAVVEEVPTSLQRRGINYENMTPAQQVQAIDSAKRRADKKFGKHGSRISKRAEQKQALEEAGIEKARTSAIEDSLNDGMEVIYKHGDELKRGMVITSDKVDGKIAYEISPYQGGDMVTIGSADVNKVIAQSKKMSADEIVEGSVVTKNYHTERETLSKEIEGLKGQVDASKHAKQELLTDYQTRADNLKQSIKDMTDASIDATEMAKGGEKAYRDAIKRFDKLNGWLDTEDAYETYLRTNFDEGRLEGWLDNSKNVPLGKILLEDLDIDEVSKKAVSALREQFGDMAKGEVSIGKLKKEQVDNILERYVPHILTKHGKEFFDHNTFKRSEEGVLEVVPRPKSEKKPSLTQDLGYGVEYNPFGQSRAMNNITMPDGRKIENPNIMEINEFMEPYLKGKNAFSEGIADIYITRAMKNTELMYDNDYMKNMIHEFGSPLVDGKVRKGFKAVVNYGDLRDKVRQVATLRMTKDAERGISKSAEAFEKHTAGVIEELGLPKKILDRESVPMIELNTKQVEAFNKNFPGSMSEVNDVIVEKANRARKIQITKDQNDFLRVYDRFLHWTKVNQTAIMPSFHVRNKASNIYNNWLGVGAVSADPKMQRMSFKTVMAKGDAENPEFFKVGNANGKDVEMSANDLYQEAMKYDAIDEGFFAVDIGVEAQTKGILPKLGKFDFTDTESFAPYQLGTKVGNTVENSDRFIHYVAQRMNGLSPQKASDSSKKYLFDYSDVTSFESRVMKRIFPYYTWMRKNTRLQVGELIDQPGKFRDVGKGMNLVEGGVNEEDEINRAYLSNFAEDWIQTPLMSKDEFGNDRPVLWNPNLPFMDLANLPDPWQAGDSAREWFSTIAPQLKVPIEQVLNKNMFFDSPIVDEGESQVGERVDHVLRQLATYNAGKGATGGGEKGAYHALGSMTGIKLLPYEDRNGMQDALDEYYENEGKLGLFGEIADTGLAMAQHIGTGLLGGVSMIAGQQPTDPEDYTGALRPLSTDSYEELSDQEKESYRPPSKDVAMAYHKEAEEISAREYEETGMMKKFAWAILDKHTDKRYDDDSEMAVGRVTNIVDGDTIDVKVGEETKRIRIMLADTPESTMEYKDNPMPYGDESTQYAEDKLFNKDARIYITDVDKYGRTVAYVETTEDGVDFSRSLIEEGLARVRFTYSDFPENKSTFDRTNDYFKAQREANRKKKGIWSIDGYGGNVNRDEDFNWNE